MHVDGAPSGCRHDLLCGRLPCIARFTESAGELSAAYAPLEARTAVYGHIHRPYTRTMDRLTVANSGSVGMPWDGDPRASYLLIDEGRPSVVRVAYDVEREVAALLSSGYPDAPRLAEMRRRGVFVSPQ